MQNNRDYYFSRRVEALLLANTSAQQWADSFQYVMDRVPWASGNLICGMLNLYNNNRDIVVRVLADQGLKRRRQNRRKKYHPQRNYNTNDPTTVNSSTATEHEGQGRWNPPPPQASCALPTISVWEVDMKEAIRSVGRDRRTAFAHCISGDFGEERHMSAGVAVVFADQFQKPLESDCVSSRLTLQSTVDGPCVFGLVTKPKYFAKPTIRHYTEAFRQLTEHFVRKRLTRLVCSPMGCVRDAVPIEVFADNLRKFALCTGASVQVVTWDESASRILRNGLTHCEFVKRLRSTLTS